MSDERVSGLDETKSCPRCNMDLPVSEFGVSRARKDGRNIYCKRCNRERTNASRQAARERQVRQKGVRGAFVGEGRMGAGESNSEPICREQSSGSVAGRALNCLSPVERVKEAIRSGPKTQKEILVQTKLSKDEIGEALADLLLWTHEVGTQEIGDTRLYFLKGNRESTNIESEITLVKNTGFEKEQESSFSTLPFLLPGKETPRHQQKNSAWVAV